MIIELLTSALISAEQCKPITNRGCGHHLVTFTPPPNNPRPHCKNRGCVGGGSYIFEGAYLKNN